MKENQVGYDEGQQTLQFYKIQLMQKQRELNDFGARFKRGELKYNRDLKQIRMSEQKAKQLLKEERNKHDKSLKNLCEIRQENMLIYKRMGELKEQKDRQMQLLRIQYNNVKNEIRLYERILPTLTFMNKLGVGYEGLMIYQELFYKCKDWGEKCQEIEGRFKEYVKGSQEKMEVQEKVLLGLKGKNLEMNRRVQDDLMKILEMQSRMGGMQIQRDEILGRLKVLQQECLCANQSVDQLTQENKSLHDKIDEIIRLFEGELMEKEEEVGRRVEEEIRRGQEVLEVVRRDYESKENSHLEQLAIFQEEEHRLRERIREDKEGYQESTREVYEANGRLKNQIEGQRVERMKMREQMKGLQERMKMMIQENERLRQSMKEIENRKEGVEGQKGGQGEKEDDERLRQNDEYERKYWIKKSQDLEDELVRVRQRNCWLEDRIEVLNGEMEEINSKYGERALGSLLEIQVLDGKGEIRSRANTCEFAEVEAVEEGEKKKEEVEVSSLQLRNQIQNLEYKLRISEQRIGELNMKIQENEQSLGLILGEKQKMQQMYIQSVKENNKNRENVGLFKAQNKQLQKTLKEYQRMLENKQFSRGGIVKDGVNVHEILEKHSDQINRMLADQKSRCEQVEELMKVGQDLRKRLNECQKERQRLGDGLKERMRENEILRDLLQNERKEKSLLTAPSLESLCSQVSQEDEGLMRGYQLQVGLMQGKIMSMEREMENMRVEREEERERGENRLLGLEEEMKYYIQEIIEMKFKVANAEMKANQKVHLYNQLKKKMNVV